MAANDFRKEVQERIMNENIQLNDQEKQLVETLLSAYIGNVTGDCKNCRRRSEIGYQRSINDPSREEYYGDRSETIQEIEAQLRHEILIVIRETKNRSVECIGYCCM